MREPRLSSIALHAGTSAHQADSRLGISISTGRIFMESDLRSTAAIVEVPSVSGVSWAAIAAGAVAAAALALLLIAFGAGLGLSAVSPWSDSGVSSTSFSVG